MAAGELTGATPDEVKSLQGEYYNTPLYEDHGIPFEVAYCLTAIGKQPDEYDGPQRFCQRRASKRDDYDGHPHDEAAYAPSCPFHGGTNDAENHNDNLIHPALAAIKHGVYAKDEHLMMDFDDDEQTLYDSIVEDWPKIYDWPSEDEDPARYRLLRIAARNIVREERASDYIDDEGEVYWRAEHDEAGVEIDRNPEENPLSREYRLLWSEITNQLAELGLTPKAQQQMDKVESETNANDAIAEIAGDAIADSDQEYDPAQFEEPDDG